MPRTYAPFHGPEWDDFALLVQAEAAGVSEPPSLLLQRALPELSSVLKSLREAVLQNSRRLAARLEGNVQGLQGSLDALLQGQVPVTFTGYFGTGPAPGPALGAAAAAATAAAPLEQGSPVYAALATVYTVKDAWRASPRSGSSRSGGGAAGGQGTRSGSSSVGGR